MKKLILSTDNVNKLNEIKGILSDLNIEVVTKSELGLGNLEIIEDEDTLEGNAIKKAVELSKNVNGIVMADDTGLFVEALNGAPGVHSARYAGIAHDTVANNKKLLEELKDIENRDRKAYFETIIALVLESGEVKTISGRLYGRIGFVEKGEHGFGYDPLFIVNGGEKTLAEYTNDEKNKISHRANALNALKKELSEILKD